MNERIEITNARVYWDRVHQNNSKDDIPSDDWLDDFREILEQSTTPILDLGCGCGNDTQYVLELGKPVIACDLSENAIECIRKNFPQVQEALCFNMLEGMPFPDEHFEVIIADLSLHYFTEEDTFAVLQELQRIMKPGGHLFLRLNSVHDVNHGAGNGREVEHHLYETADGRRKRFFDEEDVRYFFRDFSIAYLKEEIMTRYRLEKRLYRVWARKAENQPSEVSETV